MLKKIKARIKSNKEENKVNLRDMSHGNFMLIINFNLDFETNNNKVFHIYKIKYSLTIYIDK